MTLLPDDTVPDGLLAPPAPLPISVLFDPDVRLPLELPIVVLLLPVHWYPAESPTNVFPVDEPIAIPAHVPIQVLFPPVVIFLPA